MSCTNCGNFSLDDEANRNIDLAFRKEANLLTPEEIRDHRTRLKMSQQELADHIGIAVSTLSRWENRYSNPAKSYGYLLASVLQFLRCSSIPETTKSLVSPRTADQRSDS